MTDKLKTGDFGTFAFTISFRKWIAEGMEVIEITDEIIKLKDDEGAMFKIKPECLESFHLYTKT